MLQIARRLLGQSEFGWLAADRTLGHFAAGRESVLIGQATRASYVCMHINMNQGESLPLALVPKLSAMKTTDES